MIALNLILLGLLITAGVAIYLQHLLKAIVMRAIRDYLVLTQQQTIAIVQHSVDGRIDPTPLLDSLAGMALAIDTRITRKPGT